MSRSRIGGVLVALALAGTPHGARAATPPPQPPPFHEVPVDDDSPSPSPEPAATPDPSATADPHRAADLVPLDDGDRANVTRARDWFHRIQSGEIDRERLTPAFSAILTDEIVRRMAAQFGPFGEPSDFFAGGKIVRAGTTRYLFRVGWDAGAILYQFAIDDATGAIAGYYTRPATIAPRRR